MRFAAIAFTVAIIGGVPAAAQMPPSPVAAGGAHPGMFAGMSNAGRMAMRMAMQDADPRADRAATMAARDRMLAILDAERLDVPALRRAMDDERESANAAKARHQTAMITGLQTLSLADRRAFVANARAMRARVEERMDGRQDWQGRRGPGAPGMMPPSQ